MLAVLAEFVFGKAQWIDKGLHATDPGGSRDVVCARSAPKLVPNSWRQSHLVKSAAVKLFALNRGPKRAIQVCFDVAAVALCFWVAMVLRLDGIGTTMLAESWAVLIAVVPVTIAAFAQLGLYRAVVRYMTDRTLRAVTIGVGISAATMLLVSQALDLFVPRSVPGIYFALLIIMVGGMRILLRATYLSMWYQKREPVLIYGAGETGRQILQALEQSRNFRPALFADDDQRLHSSEIGGLRILRPDHIAAAAAAQGIKTAILAIPADAPESRRKAAKLLADLGIEVRVVPSVSDLVSGRVRVSDLRRVRVEELLGREPVPPIPDLMSKTTTGLSVMVTGAGGSIGSELCRQILDQAPRRLVLFDVSEFALYQIHEELQERLREKGRKTEIVPILGSVDREELVARAIEENRVETLFHAAAYKHVPLVEANVLEGVRTNVFGTATVAEVAGRFGIRNFSLISTDKAVRPTNVMGATKRMAELVMQAKAHEYPGTSYCAVRFGNVLASSGSVIPKFEKQIAAGGPITLTHPEITRYFMTIPEAAQLVTQASAMATRGEIYLLDMGEPIRILELAQTMARLQGRETFVSGVDPAREGAIEISITGLRPGEKLYEELLVSGKEAATVHPRIRCEAEDVVNKDQVRAWIDALAQCKSAAETVAILEKLPLGYTRDGQGG